MAVATSENTDCGAHEWNKIQSYTENLKYPLYVNQSQAMSFITSVLRRYIAKHTDANSWRYPIRPRVLFASALELGDNCIQNVHLGRYIVGYMVGNYLRGAVKRNFRPYNRRYTSPNEHSEYGYLHSNTLFNICLSKAQHFAPNWSFVSNV